MPLDRRIVESWETHFHFKIIFSNKWAIKTLENDEFFLTSVKPEYWIHCCSTFISNCYAVTRTAGAIMGDLSNINRVILVSSVIRLIYRVFNYGGVYHNSGCKTITHGQINGEWEQTIHSWACTRISIQQDCVWSLIKWVISVYIQAKILITKVRSEKTKLSSTK